MYGYSIRAAWLTGIAVLTLLGAASTASALDQILLQRNGGKLVLAGKTLVEAQDGGVLLQTRDGRYWMCQPEEILKRSTDDKPFEWLGKEELAEQMLAELPEGYRVHTTAHFVICYNTSEVYARWCGSLYERLFGAFFLYWKRFGLELKQPDYLLPAIIHRDKAAFAHFAYSELGNGAQSVVGYYSMETNRVNMYDITGADGLRPARGPIRTSAHINQILSQPNAERTVATIVHEATHQLAYNSGLQTRYAGNPFWVSEGLAVFFESPDLKSSKGWRGIGRAHPVQLAQYRRVAPAHNVDTLKKMLTDDSAFRSGRTAGRAYAEAWAWNYYLLRRRGKHYVAFLQALSKLEPLEEWTPEQRLSEFEKALGKDLAEVQRDFVAFMKRTR